MSPGQRAWLAVVVTHEALVTAERMVAERPDDPPTWADLGDAVTATLVAEAALFGIPPEVMERAVAEAIAEMVTEQLRDLAQHS